MAYLGVPQMDQQPQSPLWCLLKMQIPGPLPIPTESEWGRGRICIFNKLFESWEAHEPDIKSLNPVIKLCDITWASLFIILGYRSLIGKMRLNAIKDPFGNSSIILFPSCFYGSLWCL